MTTVTKVKPNFETNAWQFMRYSGILLIPLVWVHVLWKDVILGVHAIDIDHVRTQWNTLGIQIYDILLLTFTFAHGVNGLRQVLMDFIKKDSGRRVMSWVLLVFWLVISAMGAVAIVMGVPAA